MFNSIVENQAGINEFYQQFIVEPREAKAAMRRPQTSSSFAPQPVSLDDNALLAKAQAAKDGEAFKRFLEGDWVGYPSQSEAEQAFCNKLAFWTGKDPVRMDRIFRTSGLYREKWDERHGAKTYVEMTIARAIDGTGEVYQERSRERKNNAQAQPQAQSDKRPLITWNEAQLPAIVQQAEDAIIAANKAGTAKPIFQRGGLVRIGRVTTVNPKQGTNRSPDAPLIFPVGVNYLQKHLTEIANWQKWNERKQDFVPCGCPKKVAEILLDLTGEYRVAPLTAIINAPTLRPDGSILRLC